jgi:hypothetical protein
MILKKIEKLFSSPSRLNIIPDILLFNMSVFTIVSMIKGNNLRSPFVEFSPSIHGVTVGTVIFYLIYRVIILIYNIFKGIGSGTK